ncbi:MAG TPA: hypothetical protein VJ870_14535 [Amycolatopsis sp.]|nr:hypothetical protein [Amycolatopsis sp.]
MSAVWVVVIILTGALVAGLCWGPRLVDMWGRVGSSTSSDRREHDADS